MSGTPTLPTITVTAPKPENVSGTNSGIYTACYNYGASGKDTDVPGEEDAPVELEPDHESELAAHPEFQDLPEALRNLILMSPRLTAQLVQILNAGVKFSFTENLGLLQGRYDPESNTLFLDKQTMEDFASDADYLARIMVSVIAHETSHALDDINGWRQQATSLEQFLEYGSKAEAKAMLNSMLVASQIEAFGNVDVIATGYGTDVQLTTLFNNFAAHKNIDALLADYTEMFLEFPWSGADAQDLNGDGKVNQRDKLIDQYQKGFR